jgi:hypothetical protein
LNFLRNFDDILELEKHFGFEKGNTKGDNLRNEMRVREVTVND